MKNNYGEEFRTQRMRMNVTQQELSLQLGISAVSISIRENGERDFKVEELYKAYKIFGIDVGFGRVFNCIDEESEKLKSLLQYFSQQEKEKIHKKDYRRMSIQTLEKLQDLLQVKENVNMEVDFSGIEMRIREKIRLVNVLKKWQEKDGNLKRVIELLEIAVQ